MAATPAGGWSIPLADTEIGEEEIDAVSRVLKSGWLTAGPETRRFEDEFRQRTGAGHAFAVCNGTAALHLANLALGLGPGDEVLCPTLTFVASANASRYCGAEVVLCDVTGPRDLTVSVDDLEHKITPRTRAVTVVHYGGFPCRMDEILDLASRHDLAVIEDCAHAPLARYRGADGSARCVGTFGAAGAFSFFGNKNMTTGEGGMLTTSDDGLAERIGRLRSHGMTSASYDRFRGHAHDYDVTLLGHNYRIDDVRSALGRVQLARLDTFHARRRVVYRWYLEQLSGLANVIVPFAERDLDLATPHIMSVVVLRGVAKIRQRLTEAGIQTSKHYDPIGSFESYRASRNLTPVAAGLELLTLPFGPGLTRDHVARIASVVRDAGAE